MAESVRSHRYPRLQALFVTFLWSTSWVLIKIGLDQIPALPFAGLRYTLACVCFTGWAPGEAGSKASLSTRPSM